MAMDGTLWPYRDLLNGGLSRERIRTELEHEGVRRVVRGIYGPGDLEPDPVKAVMRRLPDGTVLGFHSGAAMHGFGVVRTVALHVIVPRGSFKPRVSGVVAHEAVRPVTDPVVIDGVLCAPAARCAVDLARSLRRMDALPVLDAALRAGSCTPDEMRAELARHRGLRGVCQARELVVVADGRSECRQESQLRLVLIDGRLPAPEPQVWVADENGVPCYRLDLAYRKRKIGLEYDGTSHLDHDRLRHDRWRMNWLSGQGWTMRFFTDADLYRRPAHIVATVRALLI
jgi:very-short-patch-repair endonuclease